MALESDANVEEIQGRKGTTRDLTDGAEDLQTGREKVVGNVPEFTIYLSADGAVEVSVHLSPDGGSTWYEAPESPVKFAAAGDEMVHIKYNCDRVRLTTNNATGVQAQVREVM